MFTSIVALFFLLIKNIYFVLMLIRALSKIAQLVSLLKDFGRLPSVAHIDSKKGR